ncbi:hypothetical protein FA15DRAFT_696408 [Coprinopsis marcescibilis]|uniref:Uncharacterized protein n=1 Tax=Coprinopsis marcescibilis TaxID=230819 RepID=A0A5C3KMC6_COPMA|nr:hypothetical protein FA15DRAFT_696408 [Coprinopsis marcescibilis]
MQSPTQNQPPISILTVPKPHTKPDPDSETETQNRIMQQLQRVRLAAPMALKRIMKEEEVRWGRGDSSGAALVVLSVPFVDVAFRAGEEEKMKVRFADGVSKVSR